MSNYVLTPEKEKVLYDLIYGQNYFMGRDRIFKYLNEHQPDAHISRREVAAYLSRQEVYQRLFPKKETRQITSTVPTGKYTMIACDLMDMSTVAFDGYHWLFTAVDMFTKKAYATPMKTKSESDVLQAFERILNQIGNPIKSLRSDNGSEFVNAKFQAMLKEKGITQILSNPKSPQSNGQIECMNKCLKRLINFQLQSKDDQNWPAMLPQILENTNNSINRTLKMSPNQAEKGDSEVIKQRIIDSVTPKNGTRPNKPTVKVGDRVRLKLENVDFSKTFKGFNWSSEIYRVTKMHKPEMSWRAIYYSIETEDKKPISGNFYDEDLHKIPDVIQNPIQAPVKFIVSKIEGDRVNNGVKELLVRYKGYRKATDIYWHAQSDIEKDVPKLVEKYFKDKAVKEAAKEKAKATREAKAAAKAKAVPPPPPPKPVKQPRKAPHQRGRTD